MLFHLCVDVSTVLLWVMGVEITFMESGRASLEMCNGNCNLKGLRFLKRRYSCLGSIALHQTFLKTPVLQ